MFKWCGRCVFPFSLALHPLPHLLCLWHARTFSVPFFPQSYVTINLPLGTWWPLAPLRIWGTLCAIPACLAFSPTYKTGICILIPLWPLSETVSQLLPLRFQVIVWKRNLWADIIWQLLFRGDISTRFQLRVTLNTTPAICLRPHAGMHVGVSAERGKAAKHFENIRLNQRSFCSGTLRNWAHCLSEKEPLTSVVRRSYSMFVHLLVF